MDLLLLSLPWVLVVLYLVVFFRPPGDLPETVEGLRHWGPMVSVIVPARNEEENILACVESLAESHYPELEILVVDDGSRDRTSEIVRQFAGRVSRPVRLLEGEPLPDGWFGKPWACWQGAQEARGDLLLFTDADTIHGQSLLGHTVRDLKDSEADVLTLVGRQVMASLWEKLLQPQFFFLLAARYPRTREPKPPERWMNAIANGQYLLFKREVYESVGGHQAVAGEVVEDLRFAQLLVRSGWKLLVRQTAELRTRMYRTLPGLLEGWSKNVATAALQTTVSWLLPVVLPLSFLLGVGLWLMPPAMLAWALITGGKGTLLTWALITTTLNILVWGKASAMMKGNPFLGLIYPLGSAIALFIFLKSWWRGTTIVWKGRSYRMMRDSKARPPRPAKAGK